MKLYLLEKFLNSWELYGTLSAIGIYGIPYLTKMDLGAEITEEACLPCFLIVSIIFE